MLRRISIVIALVALAGGLSVAPRHLVSRPSVGPDFTHFESGHVHPAALTPSGDRLLVVNTADGYLRVFDLTGAEPLSNAVDIPVGLEPVSVAALSESIAWVVNHLSDDVSIVNLNIGHVQNTLRVGDEPSDVVFAGTGPMAYVSVSQEDAIKVFEPTTLAPLGTIPVNGRMPRALARNADGTLVFAAVFHAGNRSSVLSAVEVADSIPEDLDFPRDTSNKMGHPAPAVGGIITQNIINNWEDEYGKLWNSKVKYSLPDVDVAEISTATNTVSRNFAGIGSVNYNIAVSPTDGRVAVASTEARNRFRFEPKLRGYLVDTRVSYVSTAGVVLPRIINPHINFFALPAPPIEPDSALGIPSAIAFSSNGLRAYVAALANNRIGVLNPAAGSSSAMMLARVPTIEGPSGIVVDDARNRIYVVGRFRNQVQVLSSTDFTSLAVHSIGFDPTPDAIVHGRRFLYGGFTSGHGEEACATCHIFGDMDNIAWDLGDPLAPYIPGSPPLDGFDPQKGPMTTQTLRGMMNTEPLHWRGDRVDFGAFNGAFVSLMGRSTPLPDSQMSAFTDFALAMVYPPNPHQHLDRTFADAPLGQASAARGQNFFMNQAVDGPLTCNNCHTAASFGPGTNRLMIPNEALLATQDMKVPQLRNLYKKTGFTDAVGASNKRGFGFTHDGAIDDLFEFLNLPQFSFNSDTAIGNADRRDLKAFMLAFDTGIAPAVGYEVTFTGVVNPVGESSVDTLKGQAALDHCDLIARGRVGDVRRTWLYMGSDNWKPDVAALPLINTADLIALAGLGAEVTVIGVPEGSGQRMGQDRDRDTYLNGDEIIAGSDPGNPNSTPLTVDVEPSIQGPGFAFEGSRPNPFRDQTEVGFSLSREGRVDLVVFDVLGRETRTLARNRTFEAGPHRVAWDGRRNDGTAAATGVYFVRLRSGAQQAIRTVVRIR